MPIPGQTIAEFARRRSKSWLCAGLLAFLVPAPRTAFVLARSAAMRLTPDDMTHLMNRYVLPTAHTPIKKVTIRFSQGQLSMSGTMVKLSLPIPFTATATLAPTSHGALRIHIVSMQAAGLIPKQLIDNLGLPLSILAQPSDTDVFHIKGDDLNLIVPALSMFPPPRFDGRVTAVHVARPAWTCP